MQAVLNDWQQLQTLQEDAAAALELFHDEEDPEFSEEAASLLTRLKQQLDELEILNLFTDDKDHGGALVTIHPGAGGTESADWASMLFNMYQRWASQHDFKLDILDFLAGDEAGIKSVTFSVSGNRAYGYLKVESGVHRLVRISPFDAGKRRHTSFASVFVYADIEEDIQIEVRPEDLKIDTYRASGAGGQHVNKTDSAVRITHLPTNIVVQCQNERSQHKNKSSAMKILKAKLYEREQQARQDEKDKLDSAKQDIAWGSQIRSYVLHPYQMVKDHRTKHEVGNAMSVLNGELDSFIKEALTQRI